MIKSLTRYQATAVPVTFHIFIQLKALTKRLCSEAPVLPQEFALNHPNVDKAFIFSSKESDNFENYSITVNINSLDKLPALASQLGHAWVGELVLSATHYVNNETKVVFQTRHRNHALSFQEFVYHHSSPTLIAAVEEITVTASLGKPLSLDKLVVADPLTYTHTLIKKHYSDDFDKVRRQTKIALFQFQRIGAFTLFDHYQKRLNAKLAFILDNKILATSPREILVLPVTINDTTIDQITSCATDWLRENSFLKRLLAIEPVNLRLNLWCHLPGIRDIYIGYTYLVPHLFVRLGCFGGVEKIFRTRHSRPFVSNFETYDFEPDITTNLPRLIHTITSLLDEKEKAILDAVLSTVIK